MKAITYSSYGPPDVLVLSDVDAPTPAADEVLIRVHAAEATKADCEMRSFHFSVKWFWLPLRLVMGVRRPRRQILGGYFCGEVVEVGHSVDQLAVGDLVYGSSQLQLGAYGEYLALPANYTLTPKPTNMSPTEAAAVPLGGLNALHFMRRANIRPGETMLINGAGGSIGLHAVQIAKSMGARVTAVDSAVKRDFVLGMGADRFIDYRTRDFTQEGKTYDIIFDMVPSSSYRACMRCLNQGGRYLAGNPRLSVMLRCLVTNWLGNKMATFAFAKETMEELQTLTTMIEAGKIKPIVDKVFPMAEATKAHRRVETEQRIGAVVLAIREQPPTLCLAKVSSTNR